LPPGEGVKADGSALIREFERVYLQFGNDRKAFTVSSGYSHDVAYSDWNCGLAVVIKTPPNEGTVSFKGQAVVIAGRYCNDITQNLTGDHH